MPDPPARPTPRRWWCARCDAEGDGGWAGLTAHYRRHHRDDDND